MTEFADLSPYTYSPGPGEKDLLNVGWLGPAGPFPTGPTSERFRAHLLRLTHDQSGHPFPDSRLALSFNPPRVAWVIPEHDARAVFVLGGQPTGGQSDPPQFMQKTQGRHGCFRCQDDYEFPKDLITIDHAGSQLSLGSGELRVRGYAAPDLLAHYVQEHDYLPPAPFVEAVEALTFEPRTVLIEPLSGAEPPPGAAAPEPSHGLRFVWEAHSDLPPTRVAEIAPMSADPSPAPSSRSLLQRLLPFLFG